MNLFKHFKSDLPASFVVFLVALPLSLGIALASGAPVKAGLIAAVMGGITVGVLGGAPLQVSGPAAGLTVMVYGFVQKFGFETTCLITIGAGLLQVILGALGAAQLALAISPAVLHAMLAGIGILIALAQTHVLLGSTPKGGAIQNITGLIDSVHSVNQWALIAGTFTLVLLLGWNRFLAKRVPSIPGSLVAVLGGTLFSLVLPGEMPRVKIDSNLFSMPQLPSIGNDLWALVFASVGLMIVASAESLLCAVATDKLHSGPRANLNRELMAQGAGNFLSGILGGLPITGVIVRSSANISAGARSQLSAILHGVWIFIFAAFFAGPLGNIPLAVLAALLIHIGVNLTKIHEIRKLSQFNETNVYFATLAGVVLINLLWGIGIGLGLSLAILLYRLSRVQVRCDDTGNSSQVTIRGSLSFLSVPQLTTELRKIPEKRAVHLAFQVDRIDHAAIEAIRAWRQGYESTGGKVTKQSLDHLWKSLFMGDPKA